MNIIKKKMTHRYDDKLGVTSLWQPPVWRDGKGKEQYKVRGLRGAKESYKNILYSTGYIVTIL